MNEIQAAPSSGTVLVEVGTRSAKIDENIAPLIRELWIAGIDTLAQSGCDTCSAVWLAFFELNDLVRFVNLVGEFESGAETLYQRMNPRPETPVSGREWHYEMVPDDTQFFDVDPAGAPPPEPLSRPSFFFHFTVEFPGSDLATVLTRLQRRNREAERIAKASDATCLNEAPS